MTSSFCFLTLGAELEKPKGAHSIPVEMYRAIPHSYLWIIPNGGHKPDRVFAEAHAGAFAKTALEFLNGDWEEVIL